MSDAVQRFVFAGEHVVRVVTMNDEAWFVAKDVCEVLGTKTRDVRRIVGDSRVTEANVDTINIGNRGGKRPLLVSEAGVYKLIMVSRKPEAVKFQDWVTDDVLPTIRKHGAYMTDSALDRVRQDPDYIYNLAKMLVEERDGRMLAESNANRYRMERGLISNRREATACQRNSVLQRRINKLEREKQDVIDEYDEQIEDLKDRLEPAAQRYWDWRSKVGRPPKGYVRPEDDDRDYLF